MSAIGGKADMVLHCKCPKAVAHGGKSFGSRRQGQPARITYNTFTISRIGHSRGLGLRQLRRDYAPLCVGQIGLVSGDGAAMLLSSGRRPHGKSKVGSRNPLESRWAP